VVLGPHDPPVDQLAYLLSGELSSTPSGEPGEALWP